MKNISFESVVNELVNIFSNEAKTATYNDRGGACYIGLCGWAGTMSPANRSAFVETFGAAVTNQAESIAHKIISDKEAVFAASKFSAHAATATANLGVDFVPAVGSYYWMVSSNLKQEGGGILGELNYLCDYMDEEEKAGKKILSRRLVRIDKVINVTEEELLTPATPDSLTYAAAVAGDSFPGGSNSEDLGPDFNQYAPTDDELKTFYTVGVAVYCKDSGRWFLIDSEGYDYARYLYLPLGWLDMYAEEIGVIDAEDEAVARSAEEEKARAAAARHAAYLARCEKWDPIMQDVRPLEKEETAARRLYGHNSAEVKKASRTAHNATRKNILSMCRAAFPGVKFSLTKNVGWGRDWDLTYYDGPTLSEFEEKTDLDLFAEHLDTFDGMTDCSGVDFAEFADFAKKYAIFGTRGGVSVKRKESEAVRVDNLGKICQAVPELAGSGYDWPSIPFDKLQDALTALASVFPADVISAAEPYVTYGGVSRTATEIQRCIFNETSYFTAPAPAPTPDDDPTRGRVSSQADDAGTASAAGLILEDYSAKAIAVFGDTAKYKDDLKQLGGRFNARLKRNGTTCAGWIFSKSKADAVAAFIAAATAPADDPADVLPSLPAVVTVSASAPVSAVSGSHAVEVAHLAPVVPSLCVADGEGMAAPADDPADVLPSLPAGVTVSPSAPVSTVSGSHAVEVVHLAPVVPSLCVADGEGMAAPADDPADVLPSLPAVVTVSPSAPVSAVSGSHAVEVAHLSPVVPSLCVADGVGMTTSNQDASQVDIDKSSIARNYVTCEKSPIFSGDLAEGFNRVLELYPRVAYQLWPAYQNVITACVLYLQYLESLSADVKKDRYAVKMLSYYSTLRDIADRYLKKRDAARLDVSPASIEADERLQISALAALQPVWAELHLFTDNVLSEVLDDYGFTLPRVHYDMREKSPVPVPSEAANVFRVRCLYEADGLEPVFDEFLEMGPRSNLDKLIGLPHRKCEYWKKGYQCKDFIVCDSPSLALTTIDKITVRNLNFVDADGNVLTPSRVWFGTDTRWARTEGGAPNGRAYTAYNGSLYPVYLGDGSRLVDASLCNVTADYVDGCLSNFRVG